VFDWTKLASVLRRGSYGCNLIRYDSPTAGPSLIAIVFGLVLRVIWMSGSRKPRCSDQPPNERPQWAASGASFEKGGRTKPLRGIGACGWRSALNSVLLFV